MHDNSNEFEKQVRQKLQDLNFTPSAPVWERVAAQLPGNRRRRAYLIWAPLLAAAMVGGFLFFYPKTNADTTKSTLTASHTEAHIRETDQHSGRDVLSTLTPENKSGEKETSGGNREEGVKPELAEVRSFGKQGDANLAQNPADQKGGNRSENNHPQSARVPDLAEKNPPAAVIPRRNAMALNNPAKGRQEAAGEQPEKTSSGNATLLNPDRILVADQAVLPGKTVAPVSISGAHPYNKSYVLTAPRKPAMPLDAGITTPDVVTTIASRKKWNLEPGFNAGQSIFNNGAVNKMFRAAEPTVLNSPTSGRQNSPAPPTLQSPGMTLAAATRKPSEIKPGKSIAIGMDLRHALTRRLSVSTGLYYNLLTTNMKIGNKVEQEMYVQQDGREKVLSEYYNTGSSSDYTNSYHFIELPVLLNVQFNRGKKIPLYMSGGVSFARLVSTDALHYDGIQNIYYADKSLVKKNYVNVQGGFSARIPAGKKLALLAGPEIQYGLTNMLRGKDENSDKHSLFIGVKVGLSF